MGKKNKPSALQTPSLSRVPKVGANVGAKMLATAAENPDKILESKIAWNFSKMDDGGDWPCSLQSLHGYHRKITSYEGKTIKELFVRGQGGGVHSHRMPVEVLCSKACTRLNTCNIDEDALHQLDLGGPARLWGVLEHNIFHILWLDPRHSVYPMKH